MFTVTQLARKVGISRSTILYYEREGLLMPAFRSENGYRWYGASEIKRLEAIVSYRSYGIPVANIGNLLDRRVGKSQSRILRDHFNELEKEIIQIRKQQKAIVALLQKPKLLEKDIHSRGISSKSPRDVSRVFVRFRERSGKSLI